MCIPCHHIHTKRVQLSLVMLAWLLLELTFDLFLTYFISNFFFEAGSHYVDLPSLELAEISVSVYASKVLR